MMANFIKIESEPRFPGWTPIYRINSYGFYGFRFDEKGHPI
jgi:hypothetical protein